MSWATVDLAAARRTLHALTPRTVALFASIANPGVPMSGSEWTVGEAAVASPDITETRHRDGWV
jgi:hypothetical protein